MIAFFLACLHSPAPVAGAPLPAPPPQAQAQAQATTAPSPPAQATQDEGPIVAIGEEQLVMGALEASQIQAVVSKHMDAIRYCYTLELAKTPSLSGKVVIKFVIAADGTVSSSQLQSTTLHNPAVEMCVAGRFMTFQFPEPEGGGVVIVSYPFVFEPG